MHTHTYPQEYTCAFMTLFKHAEEWLLRLTIYAHICIHVHIHMYIHAYVYKMHTRTYTHVYTCIRIYIYIQRHIYKYIHVSTHTYMHIYTRTRTKCTYALMQARVKRRCGNDCAGSPTWRQEAPPFSCPLLSGGGSPSVASSPIARPRGTTDKRRTTTTNSNSSHHHDSALPRLQPLICTGAEPIHPVHGPPKLRAT